jgi:protease I
MASTCRTDFATLLKKAEGVHMSTVHEILAIGETIQKYFDGMHWGDTARLRQAFHPDAYLFGYYHGEFSRISLEEWMAEVEGMSKPVEDGEAFDMRIVATDVTGRTATVKVALLYAAMRFTDYLTLMQFDGTWKIVNKSYHHD